VKVRHSCCQFLASSWWHNRDGEVALKHFSMLLASATPFSWTNLEHPLQVWFAEVVISVQNAAKSTSNKLRKN
jgi:hypothetical protein